jgi:hypothetical protein
MVIALPGITTALARSQIVGFDQALYDAVNVLWQNYEPALPASVVALVMVTLGVHLATCTWIANKVFVAIAFPSTSVHDFDEPVIRTATPASAQCIRLDLKPFA